MRRVAIDALARVIAGSDTRPPLLIYYTVLLVVAVCESALPSEIWPWFSCILLFLCFQRLAARAPQAMAFLVHILISRIMLALSLIFIAAGYFIRELGIVGTGPVYSAYFALLACGFVHVSVTTFNAFDRSFHPRPIATLTLLNMVFLAATLAVSLLTIVGMLWAGFTAGFALIDGIDRFAYRANQGWLFNVLVTFKPIIAGMMGFVNFRMTVSRFTKRVVVALFVAMFGISALFGDKFLSLLVLAGLYAAPYFALGGTLGRRQKRTAIMATAMLCLVVTSLTYFVYSEYGRLGFDQTAERLFGRFTGQGQLWYMVQQNHHDLLAIDGAQALKLGRVMAAPKDADALAFQTNTGMFYMVERYAPDNIRNSIRQSAGLVQFTGAGEAYVLLVFGQAALIAVWLLLGVMCGMLAYWVYNALRAGSLPGFVFALFTLTNFGTMLNQASFWQIFGLRAMVYLAAMLLVDLAIRCSLGARTTHRAIWLAANTTPVKR